jgi:hypothetical protein
MFNESSLGPYKLSQEQNRQFKALLKHSEHGAFRQSGPDTKANMDTREKQTWESLGNITKLEAKRRFTTKTNELKIEVDLAVKRAAL